MERREEEAGEKKDIRKRKLKKSEGEGGQSQERIAQLSPGQSIMGLFQNKSSVGSFHSAFPTCQLGP